MKKSILFLAIILVCIMVVISACAPIVSVDTTIQLQGNQSWAVEILVAFFEQDAALNQTTIEQTLNQAVQGLASQGVEASWKRDDERGAAGSAVFVMNLSGQGFELLNRSVLQQPGAFSLARVANKNQIVVSMTPQINLAQVQTVRYTVQGGEILATNGTAFDQKTTYWVNPNGRMEATLEEPRRLNWFAFGLIALGVILLGVSIFGLTNLPRKTKETSDRDDTHPIRLPAPGMTYCENCQVEIPSQAIYCPNCGKHRVLSQ